MRAAIRLAKQLARPGAGNRSRAIVTSALLLSPPAKARGWERETDKLFLTVAGRPLVAQTWRRFDGAPFIDEIILVVRDGRQSEFAELAARYQFAKTFRIVAGGKERQDSVWNGLQAHFAADRKLSPSRTPPGPAPVWP